MRNSCDFHPTKSALFSCPECEVLLCSGCVSKREIEQYGKMKKFYYCPKCSGLLDKLAAGDIIEPFWNRLHKFFVYPLALHPFLFISALSLATLLYWIPIIGIFVQIAVYVVLLKYSFEALLKTAQGSLSPPGVSSRTVSEDILIVFKQIGLYIIIGLVFLWVLKTAGMITGLLFLCFAILSIPAMIIILVTTNSLINAVNPVLFIGIAWRIGWGYLLMYLFLIFLGGAPAVVGKYTLAYLPPVLQTILATMAKCYYTIISYHLMGYVILQYHESIGYQVELDDDEFISGEELETADVDGELLKRVDMHIKEGNIDDAIYSIKAQTEGQISNLDLADRYFKLLKLKGLDHEMLNHAKVYMELLARKNMKEKLCEVYLECASKNPDFAPSTGSLFKIASALNESGKPKDAVKAYNRLIKSEPRNPMVPKAYYLGAGIINEKLKNPKKAEAILKGLVKKYPDHEIVPYALKYLRHIKLS